MGDQDSDGNFFLSQRTRTGLSSREDFQPSSVGRSLSRGECCTGVP